MESELSQYLGRFDFGFSSMLCHERNSNLQSLLICFLCKRTLEYKGQLSVVLCRLLGPQQASCLG